MNTKVLRLIPAVVLAPVLVASLSGCGNMRSPRGEWGFPEEPGQPALLFEANGELSGTDGCNRLLGKWSQDGSTIHLEEVATTLMACEGVDDWLKRGVTAELSGSTLIIFDEKAVEIGQLPQAP